MCIYIFSCRDIYILTGIEQTLFNANNKCKVFFSTHRGHFFLRCLENNKRMFIPLSTDLTLHLNELHPSFFIEKNTLQLSTLNKNHVK